MSAQNSQATASTPDKVAGEAKRRRNRKRTKSATTLRRIQAKARERQELWLEGGHPNKVTSLTVDLNGREHLLRPEGLFAEARQEARGAGEPYRGATWQAR